MNKKHKAIIFSIVVFMLLMSSPGLGYTGTTSTQSIGLTQQSSTTGGELRRHIDISNPFSGGYLLEDMTVIGSASVTESFTMNNLGPGAESDYFFPGNTTPASPAPASGSVNKPSSIVAGASVTVEPEVEGDIRTGFRWRDLF